MTWRPKTLNDVLLDTESVDPGRSPERLFEYIDVSSVSNESLAIEETQSLKGKDAPSRARRLVRANDVIFATIRPTLRRIAFVPEHLDGQICSTGYVVLRPTPELDSRFLFYFLQTQGFLSEMERLQRGASYPAVTESDVRNQRIPIPTLAEQRRVAERLGDAFAEIANAESIARKNLLNARALFESKLDELFSRDEMMESRRQLSTFCKVFSDGDWIESKDQSPSGIRLIQTGNIGKGVFKNREGKARYISESTFDRLRCTEIFSGDCLVSRLPDPVGRACLVPNVGERMITAVDCTIIRFELLRLLPKFFVYFSQSGQYLKEIRVAITGTTRDRISRSNLGQIGVPGPSVSEQQRLVDRLDELSDDTCRLERIYSDKLIALKDLKQSLLREAFAGRL